MRVGPDPGPIMLATGYIPWEVKNQYWKPPPDRSVLPALRPAGGSAASDALEPRPALAEVDHRVGPPGGIVLGNAQPRARPGHAAGVHDERRLQLLLELPVLQRTHRLPLD